VEVTKPYSSQTADVGRLGLRGLERPQRSGEYAALPTEAAAEVRKAKLVELEGIEPSSADELPLALRPFPDRGLRPPHCRVN
jgi:hypothetical protein